MLLKIKCLAEIKWVTILGIFYFFLTWIYYLLKIDLNQMKYDYIYQAIIFIASL